MKFLTMNGSVKKDKIIGKYFYIVDICIDPLTGKSTKADLLVRMKQKMF